MDQDQPARGINLAYRLNLQSVKMTGDITCSFPVKLFLICSEVRTVFTEDCNDVSQQPQDKILDLWHLIAHNLYVFMYKIYIYLVGS